MKKTLFVFIFALPFIASAQTPSSRTTDSLEYYQKAFNTFWKASMDSVKKSEQYIFLFKQLEHHRSRSNNYTGMSLFADIVHSDYDRFNESIAVSGFPAFNPISYRLGFGISSKRDRLMTDFLFWGVRY